MEYITLLGRTGLKISRMGFGGIPIQRIDAESTRALIRQVADAGVNYIDTARGYTVSEEWLGGALEGIRDRFVLATKSMARTREAMEKDIAISLGNLRTDHVELYQIHNPSLADMDTVFGPGGAMVALLAAKAGATYVSPFVGRLDDISEDGVALVAHIVRVYRTYGFRTQVLAASIRHTHHIIQCMDAGADVVTCPLAAIMGLLKHPLTDSGLKQFLADHARVNQG